MIITLKSIFTKTRRAKVKWNAAMKLIDLMKKRQFR